MRGTRKRKKEDDNQGVSAPFWILTYSDTITLVLTFFIFLYAFSTIDAVKFQQLIASVRGSFGVIDGGQTIDRNSADTLAEFDTEVSRLLEEMEQENMRFEKTVGELKAYIEKQDLDESVTLDVNERGITIRFLDSILFDIGRASLKPNSQEMLTQVAEILMELENEVRVEGYTCDLPINTPQFPSNWELSTARSTSVLRFLKDQGIPGEKLSAVGYGEYRPLVPNTTEELRRENRRVDIVILKENINLE